MIRERPERRALVLGRSATAPIVLAVTTVAAVAGAVLALLPAAVRRRPAGRLAPRRGEVARPGLRRGALQDAGDAAPDAAGEPLTP